MKKNFGFVFGLYSLVLQSSLFCIWGPLPEVQELNPSILQPKFSFLVSNFLMNWLILDPYWLLLTWDVGVAVAYSVTVSFLECCIS